MTDESAASDEEMSEEKISDAEIKAFLKAADGIKTALLLVSKQILLLSKAPIFRKKKSKTTKANQK